MVIMVWDDTFVKGTFVSECSSWERVFSFIPNWGHVAIRTDWQGTHVVITK